MRIVCALLLLLAGDVPGQATTRPAVQADATRGELAARVGSAETVRREPGLRRLGSGARAPLLYVPESYRAENPIPLLLVLHGAGGSGRHSIDLAASEAERLGFLVLAPSSRASSWDMISGRSFGADVAMIDAALTQVFRDYAVDAERVAIGGFSDGASYALSLGLANGALFRRIIAFSPGFMRPSRVEGKPDIFIAHGVADQVLPVEACSRRIVPRLKAANYDVEYIEFPAGHIVPPDLARRAYEALVWRNEPTG